MLADRRQQQGPVATAFTLLELLVVIALIAILMAVTLTSLVRAREAGRDFACRSKLKTVALEFLQFADDFAHPDRGDSEQLGRRGFYIEDFQERLYGISEFWDAPAGAVETYRPAEQPLMCPSAPRVLEKRSRLPCSSYAVGPAENVSVGINMRLYRTSRRIGSRPVLVPVRLSGRILDRPAVPLAFDVNAALAADRGVLPYYSAPPAGDTGRYGSGLFWFPGSRHGQRVNACFVGGYVLSTKIPERESGWDWRHQPLAE